MWLPFVDQEVVGHLELFYAVSESDIKALDGDVNRIVHHLLH